MTDQNEEWGPWNEHDGTARPMGGGVWVEVEQADRERLVVRTSSAPKKPMDVDCWVWRECEAVGWDRFKIIRYRIRKPRALSQLQEMIRNLPERIDA